MKAISLLFILSITSLTIGQIDKYLNEKPDPACANGPFLVGMALEDNVDFSFTLEDSERRGFNDIIAKKISSVTRCKYSVLLPQELDLYKKCVTSEFVLLKLVSYKETEVGGFERTGTIEIEALFFKTPDDAEPYLRTRVQATGESDYGHSNPIENAIEEAAKSLYQELRKQRK